MKFSNFKKAFILASATSLCLYIYLSAAEVLLIKDLPVLGVSVNLFTSNRYLQFIKNLGMAFALVILAKYLLYLILAPLYSIKIASFKQSLENQVKRKKLTPHYEPKVSVIVPAWNEEVGILATIKSVLANTYSNIEVVIVDDGSTDKTGDLVKNFIKKYYENPIGKRVVRYYFQENSGKGAALNTGVKFSKGEIIMTMDADSIHHPKAVENLVNYFHDPSVDAVVGNIEVAHNQSIVGLLQRIEYIFSFYFKKVHALFNAEYIFGGACAAFRRTTTFAQIGYFDGRNKTEDIEYSMRTKLYGLNALYAEDVIVYTEGASDLSGLLKQRLRWKKGKLDTLSKYKSLFFSLNKSHSRFLSFVVLPYAILQEIRTLFEPIFLSYLFVYTFLTGDYLALTISSMFVFVTFISSILLSNYHNKKIMFYFPAFWILYYLLTTVEFIALIKSLKLLLTKKDITWQTWSRKGVEIAST